MIGGTAAMIALGLALGLWARPNLGASHDTDAAERAAAPVHIEVDRPAPPPPVTSNGKLEVLSPDVAAASRQAAAPTLSSLATQAFARLVTPDDAAPPPPLPAASQPAPQPRVEAPPRMAALTAPPVVAPSPSPQARAGFDCGGAGGVAEQMVCSDPDLAAADRDMSRAYRRALRSGASPGALRADQRDWLGIREEAARHSRQALAQVYQQRIDELNAAADDGPPADDGY
jgi:uncharacterized protein YecT (DUF1311 family)